MARATTLDLQHNTSPMINNVAVSDSHVQTIIRSSRGLKRWAIIIPICHYICLKETCLKKRERALVKYKCMRIS